MAEDPVAVTVSARAYNALLDVVRRHERATRWEHVLALLGYHLCATCGRWRGRRGELCGRCRRSGEA